MRSFVSSKQSTPVFARSRSVSSCFLGGIVLILSGIVVFSCQKSGHDSKALPPATDWQAPPDTAPVRQAHMGSADPHAGLAMEANPHAGLDMAEEDPHAGVDMSDPAMAGMIPPDPGRTIDTSQFLEGTIVATDKTKSFIKPGAIIFLSVRQIEPVTGDVISTPVAVARLDVNELPIPFHLSEANAMSAGTNFKGTVQISARVDSDGEARSRTPGDVEGTVRATIPAAGLTLTLDSILQ